MTKSKTPQFEPAVATLDGVDVENTSQGAIAVDDTHIDQVAAQIEEKGLQYDDLVEQAREGDKRQQVDLGVYKAFRLHWRAALYSIAVSTCLVMEGFDLVIITSFYGQGSFIDRFGSKVAGTNEKEISAPWQSGLSNAALCGEIIGLAINGWASERFGYRRTLFASLSVMTAAIFVPVFTPSLPVLAFGEVLQGIPWGMFQTLTTAFAVEICPQTLRHYLTTYVCFCWGLGIFLSSVVVRATVNITSQWAWRLPFALQWVWPLPLILAAYLVPESPWWLVRKGKLEDAKESVRRLSPKGFYDDRGLDQQVSLMVHTTALEKAETKGATYLDCFKGVNLRRTEIVCVAWAFQYLCGNPFMGFAVVFFQKAGLSEINSLNLQIVMNTTYMIGTVISWKLMDHAGRRTIYTAGGAGLCVILMIISILGFIHQTTSISWATGALLIAFALYYNCSIGPVCYAIVSEIPSGRLRAKSIVLARLSYNLTGLVTNTITPRMLSATSWNWGSRGALLYFGLCALVTIWCFFRLPETRKRSFGEIELLFEHRISARKFSTAKVSQFETAKSPASHRDTIASQTNFADSDDAVKSSGEVEKKGNQDNTDVFNTGTETTTCDAP